MLMIVLFLFVWVGAGRAVWWWQNGEFTNRAMEPLHMVVYEPRTCMAAVCHPYNGSLSMFQAPSVPELRNVAVWVYSCHNGEARWGLLGGIELPPLRPLSPAITVDTPDHAVAAGTADA